MKAICLTTLSIILILSFGVMTAQADPVPAVDINGIVNYRSYDETWSLGWEFSVNTPITVTALGFFDLGYYFYPAPRDPSVQYDTQYDLTSSHDVGIYDSSGNLLVWRTVSPGDSLTNFFRYTSVANILSPSPLPIPLGTGDYVIAAATFGDYYTWWDPGSVSSSEINFVQDRSISSPILAYPDQTEGVTGYFGPNFQYEVATVPEPGILVMLAISMLGVFGLRLKWKP